MASFPPLVEKDGEVYRGFELELWEDICTELNVTPDYVHYEFKDLLPALGKGDVQVAIAGITRTSEREKTFDFSHRTLDSGLSILVPNQRASTVVTALKAFFSQDMLKIFGALLAFIVVSAHLIWWAERGGDGSISAAYLPGIFDALWWAVVTVSTVGYGDFYPVTWLGRVLGIVVILSGLAVFGLYIGQISSALTVERLKTKLRRKEDLKGRQVATRAGVAAADELRAVGARVVDADSIEDAYALLDRGDVEAVVFDTPVLQNHCKEDSSHTHAISGEQFARQTYGFAFRENDKLREDINRTLLELRENGTYDRLHDKWF